MPGFRATLVVHDPADCPVASVSAATDESVGSVNRTRVADDGETKAVEEFALPEPASIDHDADVELTPVQANDRETIYRFEREATDCACELVEDSGTPITSVRAQDGSLLLSFHTVELEEIADIVETLRNRFDGVLIEELSQNHENETADPVLVDRDVLTDRQREILETAHESGYFTYPKGANATDIADELGIARSTFAEHLAAAQTKLMSAIVEK
ncbi:helix-turn-helix domain-containing protein [Natrialbaceae archaeon A-arb3/5]